MSKEKAKVEFTDDQVRAVAEAFAHVATALAEAARHMDQFLSVVEQLKDLEPIEADADPDPDPDPDPEEAGTTIAERLRAGEIDFATATDEVTSIIIETLESTWGGSKGGPKGCIATSSPSTTPRHIRVEWAGGESCACFTVFMSGKATTGGKDSGLRQDLRATLESEGFDVRC